MTSTPLLRGVALVAPDASPPRLQQLMAAAGQPVPGVPSLDGALEGELPDFLLVDETALPAGCQLAGVPEEVVLVFTGSAPGPQARALAGDVRRGCEFVRADCAPGEPEALLARLAWRRQLRQQAQGLRSEFLTFCNRVSHDLQAAFQNILGFAEALEACAADRLEEREQRFLQRVRAGALRGNGQLLDMATLSRVAATPLERVRVDCAALVRRCIEELQAPDVQWRLGELPALWADPTLLQLALRHLLANAVKFSRDRLPATIEVAARRTPGGWELHVRDHGVGFDPAYAGRLFTPFERLHPADAYEGSGIGLALVKLIVERHGASVRAEAPADGGALFTIEWPQAELTAPQPAATAPEAPARPRGLRVLVVDDDPLVALTLRNMLARDGHEVHSAADGAAGIAAVQGGGPRFDVVICDWTMPDLDGGQVAQAVRQASPDTGILLLTGRRPEGGAELAPPPGVDLVLGKPVRAAELRQAVATVAGAARA